MTIKPSVKALLAAEIWAAAGNLNLEQLALAFDEFAAECVKAERRECAQTAVEYISSAYLCGCSQGIADAIEERRQIPGMGNG
jgi:hypothetical protein